MENNNKKIIVYSDVKSEIFFNCIICDNNHTISNLYSELTPICNECLNDLKYFVETRRPKTRRSKT